MGLKLKIGVEKPGIPPGHVLIEDAGSLANGVHDTLARLIQRQLGFPGRSKLRIEAKELTAVSLTAVSSGSGVLECELLPVAVLGRHPAAVAALDLVKGISSYESGRGWPAYLPSIARNRIGAAVAPVLSEGGLVTISIEDRGAVPVSCTITGPTKAALQAPEKFETRNPVDLVGNIYDINKATSTFRVDTSPRRVSVQAKDTPFGLIDELRWQRVFVSAFPEDDLCRSVRNVVELRPAREDEEDGIDLPAELRRVERSEAYQQVTRRSEDLRDLDQGWDTYGALPPSGETLRFALRFLRDVLGVLSDFSIDVPPPFLVPTPMGGVQFEWRVGGRELELEFPAPHEYHYLSVENGVDKEGKVPRWTAMRLIRWVVTGEDV